MRAYLRSARLAPKKANLMAKVVRGKSVPEAIFLLEHTSKKSARIFEKLLKSAVANAEHNQKQNPKSMIIKSVIVNQGMAYARGVPKARGSVRPIRKFMSHITIELGYPESIEKKAATKKEDETAKKLEKSKKKAVSSKSSASSSTSPSSLTSPPQ